ncbi:MAG: LuxR C-terminal-related transcriptional regulator, partial [Cyanobacteria bacterium]|nr:LuxR C-terminal-related transcriptional regulator [Cyanobacteriota bacterium]
KLILETGVAGYLLKSEPIEKVAFAIREVMNGNNAVVSGELIDVERDHITSAEEHLLRMLARGMKYADIARERVTAPETVRKQVDSLIEKLGLVRREELIAWAVQNGYGNVDL